METWINLKAYIKKVIKASCLKKKIQTHFHCKDQRSVRITLPWKRNDHYIDTLSNAPAQLESLSSIYLAQPSIPWALTSEPLPYSFCLLIDFHYLCELVIFWKQLSLAKQNAVLQDRLENLIWMLANEAIRGTWILAKLLSIYLCYLRISINN